MRMILAVPLLIAAGCNVQNDSGNDQVRVEYNEQRIKETATDVADTAKEVAAGAGNVAVSTGRAIKNEVGDVDVDVDENRNRNRTDEAATSNRN